MVNKASHAANYARESKQKTMTAIELHAKLGEIIAAGNGARPVFGIEVDEVGITHAIPVTFCSTSEPYDGEVVWLGGRE